jgi:hypothetical protein
MMAIASSISSEHVSVRCGLLPGQNFEVDNIPNVHTSIAHSQLSDPCRPARSISDQCLKDIPSNPTSSGYVALRSFARTRQRRRDTWLKLEGPTLCVLFPDINDCAGSLNGLRLVPACLCMYLNLISCFPSFHAPQSFSSRAEDMQRHSRLPRYNTSGLARSYRVRPDEQISRWQITLDHIQQQAVSYLDKELDSSIRRTITDKGAISSAYAIP